MGANTARTQCTSICARMLEQQLWIRLAVAELSLEQFPTACLIDLMQCGFARLLANSFTSRTCPHLHVLVARHAMTTLCEHFLPCGPAGPVLKSCVCNAALLKGSVPPAWLAWSMKAAYQKRTTKARRHIRTFASMYFSASAGELPFEQASLFRS